jgi:hypothetical protein
MGSFTHRFEEYKQHFKTVSYKVSQAYFIMLRSPSIIVSTFEPIGIFLRNLICFGFMYFTLLTSM